MTSRRVGVLAMLSALIAGSMCAGCTQDGSTPVTPSSAAGASPATATATDSGSGGTLTLLGDAGLAHLDPTRLTSARDVALASRTYLRTLTTWANEDSATVTSDLATDTGSAADGDRMWRFTLREDARWQDGAPVSCADVQVAIARSLRAPQVTGPSLWALRMLDTSYVDTATTAPTSVPTTEAMTSPSTSSAPASSAPASSAPASSAPASSAPASSVTASTAATTAGAAGTGVTCQGRTVTFHLRRAVADFGVLLTLPVFAPVRADQVQHLDSAPLSDGPYVLASATATGTTWTRNPAWTAASDPVRDARPDRILVVTGVPAATALQRLRSGAAGGPDRSAVVWSALPLSSVSAAATPSTASPAPTDVPASTAAPTSAPSSSASASLTGAPSRLPTTTVTAAPGVRSAAQTSLRQDLIVPDQRSTTMSVPVVRKAVALAVDRAGYAAALEQAGAATLATPSHVIAGPATGSTSSDPFGAPNGGDPGAARAILADAGMSAPIPITLGYTADIPDGAVAALARSLEAAGFVVTARPLSPAGAAADTGSARVDLVVTGETPRWPSRASVLAPLADGRLGIAAGTQGSAVSSADDPALDASIDAALAETHADLREQDWSAIGDTLVARATVIPLVTTQDELAWGPGITDWSPSPGTGFGPDLAVLGAAG